MEDHFDRGFELESTLREKGDSAKLSRLESPSSVANIHYLRQGDPLRLGHAVLRAASYVGDGPFAVLLGDVLIDVRDSLLARMVEVHERYGGSVLALMEVGPDQISRYGCAAVTATGEDDVLQVTGLVEKPSPAQAPSARAVSPDRHRLTCGRLLLGPGQCGQHVLQLCRMPVAGGQSVAGAHHRAPRGSREIHDGPVPVLDGPALPAAPVCPDEPAVRVSSRTVDPYGDAVGPRVEPPRLPVGLVGPPYAGAHAGFLAGHRRRLAAGFVAPRITAHSTVHLAGTGRW